MCITSSSGSSVERGGPSGLPDRAAQAKLKQGHSVFTRSRLAGAAMRLKWVICVGIVLVLLAGVLLSGSLLT